MVGMGFRHFRETSPTIEPGTAAEDLYLILDRMRHAVSTGERSWADWPTFREYASVCFWAIRKQEYTFAAEAFADLERRSRQPLHALDVGCGVVPFCNWMSRRGHAVTAVDPVVEDIEFLVRSDANGFYASDVRYLAGRGEQLEFDDYTFDVVTCVSVLEHLPPGNDRLAIREMGRVLKLGGTLIITFDVAPLRPPQPGEDPCPDHSRRFEEPFTAGSVGRLLDEMNDVFDGCPADLPAELAGLTWDDVHRFWRATQAHDRRDHPEREYLAVGGALRRRQEVTPPNLREYLNALLEGQDALMKRLAYYRFHAAERLRVIHQLKDRILRAEPSGVKAGPDAP